MAPTTAKQRRGLFIGIAIVALIIAIAIFAIPRIADDGRPFYVQRHFWVTVEQSSTMHNT